MLMRRSTTLILALALLCIVGTGSLPAQEAETDFAIRAGLVVANNPAYDSLIRVEFPFTLNRKQLEFYRPDTADTRWYARGFAQAVLYNPEGIAIDSTSTYFSASADSRETARTKDVMLFNTLTLFVKPGVYTARLQIIDAVSKNDGEVFYDRIVAEPAGTQLTIGGENLAYRIRAVDPEGRNGLQHMVRNGLEVLPNPVGLFGTSDSITYLYAEIYNLAYDPDSSGRYELAFRVLGENGRQVKDFGYTRKPKPGPTAVVAQRFEIDDLLAGMYELEMAVTDPAAGQADTTTLEFRIISPEELQPTVVADADGPEEWFTLTLEQQMQVVHWLLTPEQRKTLAGLSENGQRSFMNQYWKENDENPTTRSNETRAEIVRRWQFANDNFSEVAQVTDGWKTDRGRIYITYGPWGERDSFPVPFGGLPFEVWWYRSLDEGLEFVFQDRHRIGEYRLVHSNAPGEVYDAEWARRLRDASFLEYEQDFGNDPTEADF